MIVINDTQFINKVNQIYNEEREKIIIQKKWDKLTKEEKRLVLEIYNALNPNRKININEAKWYNTLMDFGGLIPGVGSVIDLVNGYSYWQQGDTLFAILSWIGAIPLIGDVIGGVLKPAFNVLKVGGKGVNLLKAAVLAKDATKIAEASKIVGGPVVKIIEKAPSWTDNVLKLLEKTVGYVPFVGRGFINTIKSWLDIFGLAGKELRTFESLGRPATRKLMSNTKWYMSWLDWLGLTNFKGTDDELRKLVPDLDTKVAQYAATPESKEILAQTEGQSTQSTTSPSLPPPPPPPAQQQSVASAAINAYNNPVDFLVSLVQG